jgi:hypothetical protein
MALNRSRDYPCPKDLRELIYREDCRSIASKLQDWDYNDNPIHLNLYECITFSGIVKVYGCKSEYELASAITILNEMEEKIMKIAPTIAPLVK